jgi:hypothetical protein
VVLRPRAAESKEQQLGSKMNILNEKFDFMRSTNFKLLQRIKGHLINNCQFLFKSS